MGARCLWGLVLAALLIHFIPGQGYRSATSEGGLSQLFVTAAVVAFLLAFATVGALVASRVPGNPVGWLLLGSALAYTLATAATGLPAPRAGWHAGATRASVRLSANGGDLRFEVTSDGQGPGAVDGPWGANLQAMADRVDALGGEILIDAAPGRGTTINGRVPAPALGLPVHGGGGPATWPMASLVARPSRRIALR
jgi:hypothetical protein